MKYLGVLVFVALLSTAGFAGESRIALTPSSGASGLPPSTIPDCLGVNIHFTGTEAEQVAKIADEGFRFIRMDFSWVHIEKTKGVYDFKDYDALVDSLATKGIRAYFILDYGNPLYDNDMAPHTDEGRAAFAKFAAAGAEHFRGKGVIWELWNEPNGGFWRPNANAEDYVKLAKVVYPALKKADAHCTVLAPAVAGIDIGFLDKAFKLGLLEYTDVVSLHPYGANKPEDAAGGYAKVRELIKQYAPKASPLTKGGQEMRKQYEIVSGEWGYSTFSKGVSEDTQADYVARQALSNIVNGCRVNIWYDWRDDGPDPNENEHRFGSVRQNMDPKPAFHSMKTLTTELNGYSYATGIRSGEDDDYLALFAKGDDYRLAAWTTADPHTITLPLDVAGVEIVSRSGERAKAEVKDGKIELKLTHSPQYVEPLSKSKRWGVEAAWKLEAKAELTDKGVGLKLDSSEAGAAVSAPFKYAGESRPQVTVTLKPDGIKDPLVRVIEVDTTACPRLEVLPSAGKDLLIQVHRSEMAANDVFRGSVVIGNPQGIQFEKTTLPVELGKGQTEALLHFHMTLQPFALFSLACRLEDSKGGSVVSIPAKRYAMIESFADGKIGDVVMKYAVRPEGDAKVKAEAKLTYCKAPEGAPEDVCGKLDYSFENGWKYVCVTQGMPIPIVDRPVHARVWVKGDGGSGTARLRLTDAGGQTFQPDFGSMNFTDWRCLEADMTDKAAGHWGGKNDGKMVYPIKWETMFLFDNVGGGASKGTIYVGPVMLYYD